MNTAIDDRCDRFFQGVSEFKHHCPEASWLELDRYIENKLNDLFGDTLPMDQRCPLAAFGRAYRG